MTSKFKKCEITLEIIWDSELNGKPDLWEYKDLLNLDPGESVQVIGFDYLGEVSEKTINETSN